MLEKSLYAELKKRATKQGIPISKIVTSWIQNYNIRYTKITQQKINGKLTTYNFWLNKQAYLLLVQISEVNNVQISTLLRSLIYNNLIKISDNNAGKIINIKANRLWNSGQLTPLKRYLYSNIDRLDTSLQILLARVYLELGNFNEIKNINQIIRKQDNTLVDFTNNNVMLQLIRSEMLIVQGDINGANIILEELTNKEPTNSSNNYFYGLVQFQLGLIASKLKDVENGQIYLQRAINSFDIVESPTELAKSYLFMTDFLEYNKEFNTADKYYEKATDIFSAIGNDYYCGWVTGGSAFSAYLRSDTNNALNLANKAVNIDSKSGSKKQLSYSLGVRGRICLANQDYGNSIKNFERAMALQPQKLNNTNTLNLLTLLAKSSFDQNNIKILEKVLFPVEEDSSFKKIFLHSARYLFSADKKTQEEGKASLVDISKNKIYSLQIQSSALSILKNKKMSPVAI